MWRLALFLISATVCSIRHIDENGEEVPPSQFLTPEALQRSRVRLHNPGHIYDESFLEKKQYSREERVLFSFGTSNDEGLDDFEYVKTLRNHQPYPISVEYKVDPSVMTALSNKNSRKKANTAQCSIQTEGLKFTQTEFEGFGTELAVRNDKLLYFKDKTLFCEDIPVMEVSSVNRLSTRIDASEDTLVYVDGQKGSFTLNILEFEECNSKLKETIPLPNIKGFLKKVKAANDQIFILTDKSLTVMSNSTHQRVDCANNCPFIDFTVVDNLVYLASAKGLLVYDTKMGLMTDFFFEHHFIVGVESNFNKNTNKTSISLLIGDGVDEFLIEFFKDEDNYLSFNKSFSSRFIEVKQFSQNQDFLYIHTKRGEVAALKTGVFHVMKQQIFKIKPENKLKSIETGSKSLFLVGDKLRKLSNLSYSEEQINCNFSEDGKYDMVFRMTSETCESKRTADGYCVKDYLIEIDIKGEENQNYRLIGASLIAVAVILLFITCLSRKCRSGERKQIRVADQSMDKSKVVDNKVIELEV